MDFVKPRSSGIGRYLLKTGRKAAFDAATGDLVINHNGRVMQIPVKRLTAQAGPLAIDNFTDTDGVLVYTHVPDLGPHWEARTAGLNLLQIYSNSLSWYAESTGKIGHVLTTSEKKLYCQIRPGGGTSDFHLEIHNTADDTGIRFRVTAFRYYIYTTSGTSTMATLLNVYHAETVGAIYRLETQNGTIAVYENGVLLNSISQAFDPGVDPDFQFGGYPGFYYDNYEAGTL